MSFLNLKGMFIPIHCDLESPLYSINVIYYTFVLYSCELFELKIAANDTLRLLVSGSQINSALVIDRTMAFL